MRDNKTKRYWFVAVFGLFCALAVVAALNHEHIPGVRTLVQRLRGKATVAERVERYGPTARARWQPYFERKGIAYPPRKLLLVGLKRERLLQVYASNATGSLKLIRTLPVLGMSGKTGPKLRYGDYQVPEGFYRIESLNPNSAFHLALRVNYPNEFDREQAQKESRTELGGDIMIHGSSSSVGCLAMGDEAAQDLFVLAAEVGRENISLILSPVDFRRAHLPDDGQRPAWVNQLYTDIKTTLMKLPMQ